MKKRIMIITDSMGMPRTGVPYEQTWIYLLKAELPEYDIIDRPARGSTSLRLVTEGGGGIDLLENYMPDLVILQIGITECAPRLFNKNSTEYFIINKIFSADIRKKYIDFIKKWRTRNPDLTEISAHDFKKNIAHYCSRAAVCNTKVLAISIMKASSGFFKKSPFIQQNIDLYNAMLCDVEKDYAHFHVLSPVDSKTDIDTISLDDMHLTACGHKMIFNRLKDSINELLDTKIISEERSVRI